MRLVLLPLAAVDDVRQFQALQGAVGGNAHYFEIVYLVKLHRLRHRRAGHAGELVVQAEKILKRNRRQRLVLFLDLQFLFRLHRLVKPVRPVPPVHEPPGKLVNDGHLAVLDDVVLVSSEKMVRPQRLLHQMRPVHVGPFVKGANARQLLRLLYPLFENDYLLLSFLYLKMLVPAQKPRHPVRLVILVRRLVRRPRNDKRRPRLVYEDRVHLVHYRIVPAALRLRVHGELHVVAKVVKSEFVIRPVCDVALVGRLARSSLSMSDWIKPTVTPGAGTPGPSTPRRASRGSRLLSRRARPRRQARSSTRRASPQASCPRRSSSLKFFPGAAQYRP